MEKPAFEVLLHSTVTEPQTMFARLEREIFHFLKQNISDLNFLDQLLVDSALIGPKLFSLSLIIPRIVSIITVMNTCFFL